MTDEEPTRKVITLPIKCSTVKKLDRLSECALIGLAIAMCILSPIFLITASPSFDIFNTSILNLGILIFTSVFTVVDMFFLSFVLVELWKHRPKFTCIKDEELP